ncbi:MAG: glycosyltransferase family 2 protein [Pyrinomonadaceae bacterium]
MTTPLSIVIPAYNEEARLGETVRLILLYLRENAPDAELIIVDDGSRDSTADVGRVSCGEFPEIRTEVIRYEKNRGKGFAVRTGMEAASGRIVLFSDADLSTPIEELPKLVEPIEKGEVDVAFGSRALDRSLIGNRQPWRREQGGKVFNLFVRMITRLPFWDTQCGFKAFNMEKFGPLVSKMQIDRFGFDVEFLYVAYKKGLRLREIPVRWNHCDGTKVSIFRDSFRMFGEIREVRANDALGIYD